eukprot:12136420-Ditylum_brightwellii.AAC.1
MEDEVIVNGEIFSENVEVTSYWARVTKVPENNRYKVTEANNQASIQNCKDLRHRKRHSLAIRHVSDDKVHDCCLMQHFTKHELKWLEGCTNNKFPTDIPTDHLALLNLHSDNVSQFFKSTGAIHFYTSLISKRGGPGTTSCVHSFGDTGHSKGLYDGIGGCWKNKIYLLIRSSTSTSHLDYTDT